MPVCVPVCVPVPVPVCVPDRISITPVSISIKSKSKIKIKDVHIYSGTKCFHTEFGLLLGSGGACELQIRFARDA